MSTIKVTNLRHESATGDNITLDSSGRVGIGEASPNRQLVINGGASEGVIQITNDTSGTAVANGFELIHFTNGETQLLNRENGAMRFDTNGTERIRILASGGLTFNGDTAAANALDDYEEGTWTPTIEGSTTAGTGTYAFQNGRYTKIGRLVQIVFNVSISAHTGTGNILIAGVPFAAASGIGGQFSARAENLTYTGSQILCSIDTSTLELKQFSTASGATSVPIDTSFVLRVTGTYNV